jgi:N-acetylglucosaminyldiphosphoundecaprenol N-acetyl-beta-D-mannosaminyltransferase
MIVAAQKDQELKEIINNASLRLPDGISMVVVSRILGRPLRERVSGIDFMLKAVELSSQRGYKLFLLGGKPGIAQEAGLKLIEQFPGLNIVGTHHGYFTESEEKQIITQIKDTKPDILFAGLGAGHQEKWLAKHLNELNIPVCVGVGGSFDVISGKKKRAPKWIQRLYIEWLYRLITEPERWKRQLALPKFLWLMFSTIDSPS